MGMTHSHAYTTSIPKLVWDHQPKLHKLNIERKPKDLVVYICEKVKEWKMFLTKLGQK